GGARVRGGKEGPPGKEGEVHAADQEREGRVSPPRPPLRPPWPWQPVRGQPPDWPPPGPLGGNGSLYDQELRHRASRTGLVPGCDRTLGFNRETGDLQLLSQGDGRGHSSQEFSAQPFIDVSRAQRNPRPAANRQPDRIHRPP